MNMVEETEKRMLRLRDREQTDLCVQAHRSAQCCTVPPQIHMSCDWHWWVVMHLSVWIPEQQPPCCGDAPGVLSPALMQLDLELVHTVLVWGSLYLVGLHVPWILLFLYSQNMYVKLKGKASHSFPGHILCHLLHRAKHPNIESVTQLAPVAEVCAIY